MKRTSQQNRAYHKYFDLLARSLNSAGMNQQVVWEKSKGRLDMSWSQESIKEKLWKPILYALTGKESTADMTTAEVNRVYEELDRWTSESLGVHVEFPHEDE